MHFEAGVYSSASEVRSRNRQGKSLRSKLHPYQGQKQKRRQALACLLEVYELMLESISLGRDVRGVWAFH
jgi:hypothetical protein